MVFIFLAYFTLYKKKKKKENHMQSNEYRQKFYNLHQIHSKFSKDKMQNCVFSTPVCL